jgi:hypothetical protein
VGVAEATGTMIPSHEAKQEVLTMNYKYRHHLAVSIFAAIPYLLVTWAYTKLTSGDANAFWAALGMLFGI